MSDLTTQLEQEIYARHLQAASVMENIRMREMMTGVNGTGRGGNPQRPPLRLMEAAKVLRRKGGLTASDLGHMLDMPQPNAIALLFRLEKIGMATSELHDDPRIRIFHYAAP